MKQDGKTCEDSKLLLLFSLVLYALHLTKDDIVSRLFLYDNFNENSLPIKGYKLEILFVFVVVDIVVVFVIVGVVLVFKLTLDLQGRGRGERTT